jgi:hypothetical protein
MGRNRRERKDGGHVLLLRGDEGRHDREKRRRMGRVRAAVRGAGRGAVDVDPLRPLAGARRQAAGEVVPVLRGRGRLLTRTVRRPETIRPVFSR